MSAVASITALMREDEATRTLLDLLNTEKMDGSDSLISTATVTVTTTEAPPPPSSTTTTRSDGPQRRWNALKQRLGLKAIICCGSGWNRSSSSSAFLPADNEFDDAESLPQTPPAVNLATALAEERQLRQSTTSTTAPLLEFGTGSSSAAVTPSKVSLMRLMAEAAMEACEEEGGKSGCCCVCMERKKGAAFIPCGHTFCRVCSRELWLNRGHCPLCNRSIVDVLDIF